MHRRFRRHCALFCLLATALLSPGARAQSESIVDYHSDVRVQDDGSMLVRETIRVMSAQIQIRHGIFRDFPTRYTDRLGNHYVVGFQLQGATRDGAVEPSRIEDLSNGVRIYLGNPQSLVPPGDHTYTISYLTTRQLGFFKDHDELFWNVTGNGWNFEIARASASVWLPEKIPTDQVHLGGFTGSQGSLSRDLTSTTQSDGTFYFAANHPLSPKQGLTILLTWPKGYFAEPTSQEKLNSFFEDNRADLILAVGLALILLYYFVVWNAVGRDPAKGVIVAIYEPPTGFSPAAMRYLERMGYDNKTFACAVLDMAVKGYLQIKEHAGTYSLVLSKQPDSSVLSPEEKAAGDKLFAGRSSIWLHNENHVAINAAMAALKASLKTAEQKIYFLTNGLYMIPAIVISIVMLALVVTSQGPQKMVIAGFICIWLTIWSFGVAMLVNGAAHLWQGALHGGHLQAATKAQAVSMTVFAIPFVAGEIGGIVVLTIATSILVMLAVLFTIGLHVLFHYLLKRPTSAGRSVLDKIDGFKMFLGTVEGDRLNRVFPPEQTPEVFEKFLPYALALGVEQAWAQKFSGVLGSAGQAAGGASGTGVYSPAWYSGGAWSSLGAAGFAGSLSGSFSSAISSSASAPGSSGGGGGGGSGGGGGGGGGGGW
ncbi:MAG: DUF2207 domain-containing protein [Candidatus Acidiferrales bacterium]